MSNEQQELLDEAYNTYSKIHKYAIRTEGDRSQLAIESLEKQLIYTQEEFIDKCKTNPEFSEKWGLKIEERELTWDESNEYYNNHQLLKVPYLGLKVPTRLITITYNDKTITSYE
jgi:hypothetical protein